MVDGGGGGSGGGDLGVVDAVTHTAELSTPAVQHVTPDTYPLKQSGRQDEPLDRCDEQLPIKQFIGAADASQLGRLTSTPLTPTFAAAVATAVENEGAFSESLRVSVYDKATTMRNDTWQFVVAADAMPKVPSTVILWVPAFCFSTFALSRSVARNT